jgi:methyltransferase (TIGR00027 family)
VSRGDVPSGVGKTALGVALVRAEESRRSDRLFDDPYASAFLDAAPGVFDAEQRAATEPGSDVATWGAAFWRHAVIRTRFFDDWLLAATNGDVRQVVLVAAGLDTRAYRLEWPSGVVAYELDLPDMFAFKDRVLAEAGATPRCERRPVAVDLRGPWADPLLASGLDQTRRVAWLVEGLFIYLSADEAERLLAVLGDMSVSGSMVAFEFESLGTDPMRERARGSDLMAAYSAIWKGGLIEPDQWLATHGWRAERHGRAAIAARYGRPVSGSEYGGFITATRV